METSLQLHKSVATREVLFKIFKYNTYYFHFKLS